MSIVDSRGRLFGRVNLVDAAVALFLLALLPVGYGAYLLFRPTAPRIDSVTTAQLNKEEFRIASGAMIAAKVKVRGTGFNPLLRAHIGDQPALAFVFENPNSADVLVGDIPAGTYDLILFDGVQEVARARSAVEINHPQQGALVRAVGRLIGLTDEQSARLKPGFRSGEEGRGAFEVVAIGSPRPAHTRIRLGDSGIDIPSGSREWPAVLLVHCDGAASECTVGGASLHEQPPVNATLDGKIGFLVDELLPTGTPTPARVQVRFTGPQSPMLQAGDRDALLDPRAAVIRAIVTRDAASVTATLELGADPSSEGWSYRGHSLRPGAPFRLVTGQYEAEGVIARTDITTAGR